MKQIPCFKIYQHVLWEISSMFQEDIRRTQPVFEVFSHVVVPNFVPIKNRNIEIIWSKKSGICIFSFPSVRHYKTNHFQWL